MRGASTRPAARWRRLALPAALLIVSTYVQAGRLDSQEQHVDEGWWLTSGKVSWDLLVRHGRSDHPIWTHFMSSWGSANPQLGKLLIGASLHRFAGLPPVPLVTPDRRRELTADEVVVAAAAQMGFRPDYDFHRSLEANRAAGRVPPTRFLAAGRRGVLAVSIVASALFWWLARSLAGEAAAAFALALWLAHPALADHSVRAMIDMPALAGTLLGLIGAVAVVRRGRLDRLALAALGVSALGFALGVATKLNVLAALAGALLAALAWTVHDALRPLPARGERRRPVAWIWALALVVAPIGVTFASNPMLWTRPWTPIAHEPDRISLLFSLGPTIETYESPYRLPTLADRLAVTARFLTVGAGDGERRARLPLEALLFVCGLFAAAARLVAPGARAAAIRGPLAFAAISLVTWAITIAWLPFSFERFFLPLLPAHTLAAAWGATVLTRRAVDVLRRFVPAAAGDRSC
jgi:hypothetical protein